MFLAVSLSAKVAKIPKFSDGYDEGYQAFKIGSVLCQLRESSSLTQEQVAKKLQKKSAISRIENHAEDIRLSTLEKFANVLGKRLEVSIK